MSRFGKSQEDQLRYKNSKLYKQNEELVNRINNELVPALNQSNATNNLLVKVLILALFELGGSIELSYDDISNTSGSIQSKEDTEKKTTTFYLKSDGAE